MEKTSVKLLFIGAGPAQATGIETAVKLGCKVVALDGNPEEYQHQHIGKKMLDRAVHEYGRHKHVRPLDKVVK